ncbi:MAG: DNA translocase FtsK [Candidatus Aquirickettsiella gammari]|uniref:DNA translocase FtsK n=1 Tax=Candidatus Aquirickettsiella gammari TaxID=2016198 RepID=A0A370CJV4_9COXI|nr:MAG: DNA translocase FtsK [Candidatus Aquirickettsiella gammari]
MKRNRNEEILQLSLKQRLLEGLLIVSGAMALFLLLALWTYHPSTHAKVSMNIAGHLGDLLAHFFFNSFGSLAYLFPALLLYSGWQGFKGRFTSLSLNYPFLVLRLLGYITIFIAACGLAALHSTHSIHGYTPGGQLGNIVTKSFIVQFNVGGSTLFLFALLLASTTLATGFSWLNIIDKITSGIVLIPGRIYEQVKKISVYVIKKSTSEKIKPATNTVSKSNLILTTPSNKRASLSKSNPSVNLSLQDTEVIPQPPLPIKPYCSSTTSLPLPSGKKPLAGSSLPSLTLLDPPEKLSKEGYTREELERLSRDVELRLKDFGIQVHVVAVHPGPVVTRFEMQPAAGIKVSRITGLAKDLARSLSVVSVRIVEVIPGKSVIGLEVPNKHREIVRLSEILSSTAYQHARSPLSLALGKDIAGHPVIVDLGKMPHLLVAGTTGSGKSVGLNAMLLSILYKTTPEQVRLIMIDPKMLELAIYEGIPHLLAPVVTDMKEAANALRWCVAEMERRYKLMANLGVRNLAGHNQKIQEANDKGQTLYNPFWSPEQSDKAEPLVHLPYIIVLIDEFADMIMVVGKKVEELIARIAQKARAAGIHLILATQRPSVDVITGLIKANIPTRISFQVSSKIDSRTILDQQGAEQLLGHGDMLYLAPGTGVPIRVHGAFVADQEVHHVVNALKQSGTPEYGLDLTKINLNEGSDLEFSDSNCGEKDALYDQAVQIVIETRRASISSIQRRLKIGYNRAARLMEDMEKAGLVSAMESNGNREILIPDRLKE